MTPIAGYYILRFLVLVSINKWSYGLGKLSSILSGTFECACTYLKLEGGDEKYKDKNQRYTKNEHHSLSSLSISPLNCKYVYALSPGSILLSLPYPALCLFIQKRQENCKIKSPRGIDGCATFLFDYLFSYQLFDPFAIHEI